MNQGNVMEIKINREIREYTENMFFGLSLRQCIFSLLACGVAVAIYFLLKPYVGVETMSWLCVLGAAPFGAFGFIRYHGMYAEQFVWAFIKSEILMPKHLTVETSSLYYELLQEGKNKKGRKTRRERKHSHDENIA